MRTRGIHAGDLVLVKRLGRLFYAKVSGLERAGVLAVEPLDRRVSYWTAKAREVVDHWAHACVASVREQGVVAEPDQRGAAQARVICDSVMTIFLLLVR